MSKPSKRADSRLLTLAALAVFGEVGSFFATKLADSRRHMENGSQIPDAQLGVVSIAHVSGATDAADAPLRPSGLLAPVSLQVEMP